MRLKLGCSSSASFALSIISFSLSVNSFALSINSFNNVPPRLNIVARRRFQAPWAPKANGGPISSAETSDLTLEAAEMLA